jgi:hypothetical protein
MSEEAETGSTGPYDQFLTERLADLRSSHPQWPLTLCRMHLIKALHDETPLSGLEATKTVDAYYLSRGLGIPQPSAARAFVFALLAALVLLVPLALVYFLWQYLSSR